MTAVDSQISRTTPYLPMAATLRVRRNSQPVDSLSGVVSGRGGGAGAAGGQGPAGDARGQLFGVPVGGLLGAVVGAAARGQVALIGGTVGPRDRVVQVGVQRLGRAAGGVAGGGAGADQVPQVAAGGVVILGPGVVAGAAGDRGEGEV